MCVTDSEPESYKNKHKNHFFLTGQSSTTSFAITYTGVATLSVETSWFFVVVSVVHPFMTHHFYCSQEYARECAQAHGRWMLPLGVLAGETFWNRGLDGKELEISLGCVRSSTAPPQWQNEDS